MYDLELGRSIEAQFCHCLNFCCRYIVAVSIEAGGALASSDGGCEATMQVSGAA